MYRSAVRYLKFKPEDGLHVIARGRLGVYEPKGEYQILCDHLRPAGLGALQLAFEQLKKKLQAEGLFDQSRKRPLPALPHKIGIVTSLEGAALRDIIKVLRRRHPNASPRDQADAGAGGRSGCRDRGRDSRACARPRRGSLDCRARRWVGGRSAALQSGAGGTRHCQLQVAGGVGGRPRGRLHDRRLRRRRSRAHAVRGGGDRRLGQRRIVGAARAANISA